LNRWRVAMMLMEAGTFNAFGVHFDLMKLAPAASTVGELVDNAIQAILSRPIHPADRDQLVRFVSNGGRASDGLNMFQRFAKLTTLDGLLTASPYCQWH